MKVLVVGGGGREHAIADKVRRSRHAPEVLCAPGNGGTASFAENVKVVPDDINGLTALARDRNVDLTIVGPEAPLCAGIVDAFEDAGLRIFGPCAEAARLEGDKVYCKKLLVESGVPTAMGKCFTRYAAAKAYIATRDTPQVVKAAGLAAGKGVTVCDDPADTLIEAEKMLVYGKFGDAGRSIVVEEKLDGEELSVHALVDGRTICVLESSQDHKRVGDGDTGPNTGGMGAYSPAPVATEAVMDAIVAQVIVPTVDALRRRNVVYRGVLYCGLMMTPAGPKVLEYNCRFGDPETQVLIARLRSDLIDLANACIDGVLDDCPLEWDPRAAVCVVAASAGYPGSYETGQPITGIEQAEALDGVTVYHAGTRVSGEGVATSGGRVLGVTALGDDIAIARDRAYSGVDRLSYDGLFCRRDIADRALNRSAAGG